MKVATGREKADIAIINAQLLNVYSGELLDRYAISIKGEWIAYVGDDPADTIGPHTEIIDAKGQTVIPGLIDGHTHLAWYSNIYEFLKYAMKGGTTTIITESMEPFPVGGYKGVIDFLSSLNDQPVKIFATAPVMASISKKSRGIPIENLKKLLAQNNIVGLGESYWQSVIQEPERQLPLFNETLLSGKVLEGHSAGARGNKLQAYIASGISSCHEPINAEEVLERLRLGIYVMIREGSVRRDLEKISKIKDYGVDLRRLILVSDGLVPKDLLEKGYMEFIVQKAINCGFDPISAVQMATLNVAEHFALDGIIGGIAPGKYADIVIIPDPNTIEAQYVISKGKIISKDGSIQLSPRKHDFSANSLNSIHLPRKLDGSDFSIAVNNDAEQVEVRIIDQVTDLVTKENNITLPVSNNQIRPDVNRDVLKIAAIERTHGSGKIFTGLLRGFCMNEGAFATSGAWDTSVIVAVGTDEEEMAFAVNRIYDMQGGAVVCHKRKIKAELPMPILGILSDMPVDTIAKQIEDINGAASKIGVPFDDPLTTLSTLTTAAIPYLRICEEGLVNLRNDKTLGVILDNP
jgi:adenine deaminase